VLKKAADLKETEVKEVIKTALTVESLVTLQETAEAGIKF